jgi:uncharacterized oligopeptide transporter (OPT) family protein
MLGQLIGCAFSSLFTVAAYQLYSIAYKIGGPIFPAPNSEVPDATLRSTKLTLNAKQAWLDMARLLNGEGVPAEIMPFCLFFGMVAAALPALSYIWPGCREVLPSSIGFAVGMYVLPSFTVARFIGSALNFWWERAYPSTYGRYILVLASGCILGEGVTSVFTG